MCNATDDMAVCTEQCVSGCECPAGFCYDEDENCVLEAPTISPAPSPEVSIPTPPSIPVVSILCGPNAVYSTCGTACPLRCDEDPPEMCIAVCETGCFCKEGFCLNDNNLCVEDCRRENGLIGRMKKRLRRRFHGD